MPTEATDGAAAGFGPPAGQQRGVAASAGSDFKEQWREESAEILEHVGAEILHQVLGGVLVSTERS